LLTNRYPLCTPTEIPRSIPDVNAPDKAVTLFDMQLRFIAPMESMTFGNWQYTPIKLDDNYINQYRKK